MSVFGRHYTPTFRIRIAALVLLSLGYTISCSDDLLLPESTINTPRNNYPSGNWRTGKYDVFTNSFIPNPDDTTSSYLDNNHPAIINMRKRAHQIADVSWTPLGNIPNLSGFFSCGGTISGIPYSSVKELDKNVGQEVSFYTFLSAVANPRSVLYTERVNIPPYKGLNCATYYGSVCSMTVNYALGLDRPYESKMFGTLPFIKRVTEQTFSSARAGDIVWRNGHVLMIIDVDRNEHDEVMRIEILENAGNCAFIKTYTLKEFESRWEGIGWVLYRYVGLSHLADETGLYLGVEDQNLSEINFNTDLSLNRGDHVTYREGETVIVNILSSDYSALELYKDGELLYTKKYTGTPDVEYAGLSYGKYQARLVNDTKYSNPVSFEVLQTDVSVNRGGDYMTISFSSSNSIPEYVVFCNEIGSRFFISDISSEEKWKRCKIVKLEYPTDNIYVKVIFKGHYGRVSNAIIPLS